MSFSITSVFFNPVLRAAAEKDPNVLRAVRGSWSSGGPATPTQLAAEDARLAKLMAVTEPLFQAGIRPSLWGKPGAVPAAGSPSGQAGDQGAAASRQGPVGQMSAGTSPFGRRQAGKTGAGGSLASIAAPVGKSDVPAAFKK